MAIIFVLLKDKEMAVKKAKAENDATTEEKIKNAARVVFLKKGYAATRTRDIAEEAGINLALLNYYFRSKEKLFDIIMMEIIKKFLSSIGSVFNDEKTTIEDKIETLVHHYIDLLTQHPDIPLFILSELRAKPNELVSKMGIKEILMKSFFLKQFEQAIKEKRIQPMHPLHFIMNLMGMTVFPFIASPLLKGIGELDEKNFNDLMQQRKTLVPKWIETIMKTEG
jgi:AcrR family transcriptional regulator